MNKASKRLLAAGIFLAVSGCSLGNAREHARVTQLHEIQLHPGVNKIDTMLPDGRSGMIVEGVRQDASGHAATVYMVMVPDEAGIGWNVVTTGGNAAELVSDAGSAVRFARGWLDGAPETLLFTATGSSGNGGPAPYIVDTYRLATGRKAGAPSGFERVGETTSSVNYSSPDTAIQGETGLP